MQDKGERLRCHLHGPRKRVLDGDDDEESGEDQCCQSSRHHGLGAQILGCEEECEPDSDGGTAEQNKPDNPWNCADRRDEPCPACQGHEIELAQRIGKKHGSTLISGVAERSCPVADAAMASASIKSSAGAARRTRCGFRKSLTCSDSCDVVG